MNCHYCPRPMKDIVHDRRGCLPVCAGHEQWRRGQSSMPGHGAECADAAVRVVIGGWLETDPRSEERFASIQAVHEGRVVRGREAVQIAVQHTTLCKACRGKGCSLCHWDGRVKGPTEKWALPPGLTPEDLAQAKAKCLAANERIPGSASPILLVAEKIRDDRLRGRS